MATNEQEFTPYAWEELKQRWEREEITVEQLGGQLLVWLRELHRMQMLCQRTQEGVDHMLVDLDARLQDVEAQLRT